MYFLLSVSWTSLLILAAAALSAWEICWIVYCRTLHPLAKVPGPFLASFSRFWIWSNVRTGQMHHIQTKLHVEHGSLIRIAPNELACSDPAAIKLLYRNQDPLEKSDFYTVWTNTSFGKYKDHFSVTNEKEHASRRRIVNRVYSMSNILKSEDYIDQCSLMFIQKLGEFADRAQPFDLGQWLQMYAFDVIGELYFGRMFGFMETGKDYHSLIHSLDVLNPLLASLAVSATYARPLIQLSAIAFSSIRSALKSIDHVVQTAKACVTQRQHELKIAEGGQLLRQDLLQQMMCIMQEHGEKVDFGIGEVQYEAYVALFAGSDTTAIAMRSVFYHLARSPQVLSALLDEIDAAFPASTHPLEKPIPYADAIKLPLLCATIKEAMRLHPSVGFTMPRVSPSPNGLTLNDVVIPPGYRVGINAHVVQRHKDVFGNDSNEFRPQRWLAENDDAEHLKEMDRCMLNFGAGTRTCIGKNVSWCSLCRYDGL